MKSIGSLKSLSLTVPIIDDHGFLDFCFYVIRKHQLHVESNLKRKNEKNNVCDVSENVKVCSEKSGENVNLMNRNSGSDNVLCKCLEELVRRLVFVLKIYLKYHILFTILK